MFTSGTDYARQPPSAAVQVQARAVGRPHSRQADGRGEGGSNLGKRARVPEAGPSSNNLRKRNAVDDEEERRSASRGRSNTPALPPPAEDFHTAMDVDLTSGPENMNDHNDYNEPGPSRSRAQPSQYPHSRSPAPNQASTSSRPLFLPSQDSIAGTSHYRIPAADFPSFAEGRSFHPAAASTPVVGRAHQNREQTPILSQLVSVKALNQIKESGLGIEDMNTAELDELIGDFDPNADEDIGVDTKGDSNNLATSVNPSSSASTSGSRRRVTRRIIDDEEDEDGDSDYPRSDEESWIPATQAPNIARKDGKVRSSSSTLIKSLSTSCSLCFAV